MHQIVLCTLLLYVFTGTQAQLTCVPIGTCSTGTNPGGVDVRIVTPGGIQCPPGTEPCGTNPSTSSCGTRAMQGADADGLTAAGAFPWLAFLVNQTGQYYGGGFLIDANHIITAAHKVAQFVSVPSMLKVYLGVWNPSSIATATARVAVRIAVHPSYNPATLRNNIAIVRLDSPVPLSPTSQINCINLPAQGSSYIGRRCVVAGWGYTNANPALGTTVGPQKVVSVPIVDYTTCRTAHSSPASLGAAVDTFLDPVGQICAGGEAARDACTNDGGAPLMCTDQATGAYTAVGIVIWGKGCGTPGLFGVYTNVAYYRAWITATLGGIVAGK